MTNCPVCATSLGVKSDGTGDWAWDYYWCPRCEAPQLLFVVPMLCAYVDMLVYERVISIHLIAKYIREYTGEDNGRRGADEIEVVGGID